MSTFYLSLAGSIRTRHRSAVCLVPWKNSENVEDTCVCIQAEPDAPVANPQPPLGWLDIRQAYDIAMLIGSIAVECGKDALTELRLETVRLF